MEIYTTIKISNQMLKDFEFVQSFVKLRMAPQLSMSARKCSMKVLRYNKIETGEDGDDFIMNITTILLSGIAVKVPRILLGKRGRKNKLI